MKTIRRIMTIAGLMAIAVMVRAQSAVQGVDRAFDEFCNKLYSGNYITSSTQSTFKNGLYKATYFAMPAKNKKLVADFNNALFGSSKDAYSSFIKKAGSSDKNTITVGYMENNSQTIEFGAHPERNYNTQFFRDRQDSTMRYVYALVWYYKGDSLIGSADKIYGKDPKVKKSRSYGGWSITDDGIVGPGLSITDDGIQLADGVSLGSALKSLSELKKLGNIDDMDNVMVIDNDSIDDPIQKFTNLQIVYSKLNNKYKDYTKFSGTKRLDMLNVRRLMIATNNQIRSLINSWRLGRRLTSDDKDFMSDQLKEMSSESKDKWLKKSLNELADSLRK